jgi:polysaccharide deacetylase 2 family uncharacterized protein YibQ
MAKKLPAKRKSTGRARRFDRIIIGGIIVALVAIVFLLWGPLRHDRSGEEKKPPVQTKKSEPASKKTEKKTSQKTEERSSPKPAAKTAEDHPAPGPAPKTVYVAIVIDDLGQDLKQAQEILSVRSKITLAIMPGLAQSKKIAELARQNNREILLHLPMEYRSKNGKPAPGMLRSDMTPMEFLNTITDDLGSVPGATGVNNHEGSSLTENKEAMKFLMAELKARNLFFLDSFTSARSVAYNTAKEFGLKTARRDIFLDNEGDNPLYIRKQLDELAEFAKKHGKAVGIGHPHPVTISELRKWLGEASGRGIEIVPVSRLIQ